MTADSPDLNGFFTVRWVPEGSPDIGELMVAAQAKGYSGRSSAYFNGSAVIEFAGRLTEYPLPSEPLELRSGHLKRGSDELDEHVGISVVAEGNLGQVGLVIHLAEVWPSRPDARAEVRLEILTTYERLRRFGPELARVVRGERSEARLDAETLRA
jgi:hypothetical protein